MIIDIAAEVSPPPWVGVCVALGFGLMFIIWVQTAKSGLQYFSLINLAISKVLRYFFTCEFYSNHFEYYYSL